MLCVVFPLLFIPRSVSRQIASQGRKDKRQTWSLSGHDLLVKIWSLYSQCVGGVFSRACVLPSALTKTANRTNSVWWNKTSFCHRTLFSVIIYCPAKYTVRQRSLWECDLRGINSICCCFSSAFGESGCRPSGLKPDLNVNSCWIKAG